MLIKILKHSCITLQKHRLQMCFGSIQYSSNKRYSVNSHTSFLQHNDQLCVNMHILHSLILDSKLKLHKPRKNQSLYATTGVL